ncbi:MAG: hypothetical protein KatS3mg018_1529 [Fimbriimonadales bacterium]|nr:MAG: hypothetical protein KatS3mg018_1529 [Fimbriimonadales bacterium]
MLFFVCMAILCAWLGARLRDRWLWVNAVLFAGIAGTPYLSGATLAGWWLAMGFIAFWAARRVPAPCPAPSLPTPPVHYAVCRPYHSSATSEDRA